MKSSRYRAGLHDILYPDFQFELHHTNLWMSIVISIYAGLDAVRMPWKVHTQHIKEQLNDTRQGMNKQFTLADLVQQSVYSRLISSQRIWDRGAALASTLHWFETELLTREENLIGLMALNRETRGRPTLSTAPSASCSTWIRARVRFMVSMRAALTTDTSGRSATTHCFCSMVTGTAWQRSCVRAMCTAPKTGTSCC